MNYFPFHLGDYAAHTAHLEPMEDLAYRRLLDQYYLKEGPLPADVQVTAKLIRMRSMADDVESVLKEFFMLTDRGWTHDRCEAEIAHMQDKQAKARASAAASVKSRQAFAAKKSQTRETSATEEGSERSTDVEDIPTDVELPTPTPTPTPVKEKKSASALTIPGVDDDLMADFLKIRKAKKAPLTQTAIAGIQREADKAGLTIAEAITACVECNWQGFNAGWYAERQATKSGQRPPQQTESFAERDQAQKRRDWEEMTGRKWPAPSQIAALVIDEIKEIEHQGAIA